MQGVGKVEVDEKDKVQEEEEEPKAGEKRKCYKLQQLVANSLEAVKKSSKVLSLKAKPSASQQFKPST